MTDEQFEERLQEEGAYDLANVLEDIWIDDDRRAHELDKNDIVLHIVKHVDRGIKEWGWSYESWLTEVADVYFSE